MLPVHAAACGVCIEDKVAITYDHAVVVRALAERHIIVFIGVDGVGDPATLVKDARRTAERVRGVDRSSVRAAASPAALSFALDPTMQTPKSAVETIEREVRTSGLKLTVLRVMR